MVKTKQKYLDSSKKWKEDNKERVKATSKAWREKNIDKLIEYGRVNRNRNLQFSCLFDGTERTGSGDIRLINLLEGKA